MYASACILVLYYLCVSFPRFRVLSARSHFLYLCVTLPHARKLCDLTLFAVEDLDTCLMRRLRRDIAERGRTMESVLVQYDRFVKPGFKLCVVLGLCHRSVELLGG